MGMTFPNETAEHRAARDRLLAAEVELRRMTERVAEQRRALPPGGPPPQDYVFEGPDGGLRLSELFAERRDSLAIYQFMFPRHPSDDRTGPATGATAALPLSEGPCPSCVALLDQLDGMVEHVEPRMNFVVVAKAPFPRLAAFARERGWRRLKLLSAAGNSFKRDYGGESEDGASLPILNVFHRADGVVRHFWSSEMLHAPTDPGQDPRHVGTLEPSWNLFDLIPEGRGGDWNEQFDYACCHGAA